MRIRVVKNFGIYKAGQEFDWSDGMARVLAARGLIEPVDETKKPEPPQVEEADDEPQVEQAIQHTRRKRR